MIQAKDISYAEVLAAYERVRANPVNYGYVSTWNLEAELSQYPYKVVRARLKALNRRGLLLGCACGCRGDWELPR
jgi:hypothetical protein